MDVRQGNPPRITETITVEDYVAFLHQYFGFTHNLLRD
jgi:hypothetical protein